MNFYKILHIIRTALRSLRRNPMRAALTMLGIIIGVAGVIASVEIGSGVFKATLDTIESMGSNNMIIKPGAASVGSVSFGTGSAVDLSPGDCEAIQRECDAVRSVAPIVFTKSQVVYGGRNWLPSSIFGTTPSFLDVRGLECREGEIFTDHDVSIANNVCIVGETLVRELFDGESPIGKEIRVRNVPLTVIGVLSRKGGALGGEDQDDILLVPWTTIKFRVSSGGSGNRMIAIASDTISSNQIYPNSQHNFYPTSALNQIANAAPPVRFTNIDQILVSARYSSQIPLAIRQITSLLRERHRLRVGQPDDFIIKDMTELTTVVSRITALLTKLLLSIAAISLMVGGVGIMNIMFVSVTERTREIGLRMAVGAKPRDILRQFLVEAIVLCLIGGAVGILVGCGGSYMVTFFLHWPTETSFEAIAASVVVAAGVGIIFGFYPAWKASRLDPIEALRYE